ncbi:MAG: hypothetical protein IJZ54_06685 [Clostridia bacterium]|nr:hypothetical protein [Clostridia bacterium]
MSNNYIDKLFCRGYLISERDLSDITAYPFLEYFNMHKFGRYYIYIHKEQHFYYYGDDNSVLFLIGNCINPFTMQYNEIEIVNELFNKTKQKNQLCIDTINEFTGDFFIGYIHNNNISFITDPTEMLFCTYAIIDERLYLSSHYQLIADIFQLEKDNYTKRFESYRFFYKYGLFFPGDRTPYSEIKRALTNHLYNYSEKSISYIRIFPTKEIHECTNEIEYTALIEKIHSILKNTLICASNKWNTPAISLTGGMDSKTTLAATNGLEDKFFYYSYCSMPGDKIDADAAHEIAQHIGVNHTIFNISDNDDDFPEIEKQREILQHNNGGYTCNKNDVRKRAFFNTQKPFEVEIKSWISEIGRANYYKKFGLKKMPDKLSPRQMTSMYKIFLTERKLAKETDNIFQEFINKSGFDNLPIGYDASDMYLWEFRYSAWGGIVITSEHSYSNEIFIPYNNRLLIDLMLTAPKNKRISDEFHEDIIKYGNPKISETGITITNWNETKSRQIIEKFYFLLHSFFKKF